jgi:hypothetical protein
MQTINEPAGASFIFVYSPSGIGKTTLKQRRVSQLITRPGFFRYKQVRETLQNLRRELGIEP